MQQEEQLCSVTELAAPLWTSYCLAPVTSLSSSPDIPTLYPKQTVTDPKERGTKDSNPFSSQPVLITT